MEYNANFLPQLVGPGLLLSSTFQPHLNPLTLVIAPYTSFQASWFPHSGSFFHFFFFWIFANSASSSLLGLNLKITSLKRNFLNILLKDFENNHPGPPAICFWHRALATSFIVLRRMWNIFSHLYISTLSASQWKMHGTRDSAYLFHHFMPKTKQCLEHSRC